MADTKRSLTDLLALLQIGVADNITAQDLRDVVVTAIPTGRSSTFVVASSTAPDLLKFNADYVCDGTADDVQIQAAIDALPAEGGDIFLTAGTFNYAATITCLSGTYGTIKRIRIHGVYGATILAAAAAVPGLVFNRVRYVMIDGLIFDGNDDTIDYGAGHPDVNGLRIMGCQDVVIRDVEMYDYGVAAWFECSSTNPTFAGLATLVGGTEPTTRMHVENFFCRNCANDGWYQGWLNKAKFINCNADDNGANGCESNSQDIEVIGGHFNGNAVCGWSQKSSLTRTIIIGATADLNDSAGFAFDSTGGDLFNLVINGCQAKNNGNAGIDVVRLDNTNTIRNVSITGCILESNSQVSTQNWGNIIIERAGTTQLAKDITITGCILDGSAGITQQMYDNVILYACKDVVVDNNVIRGGQYNGVAIRLGTGASAVTKHISVTSNRIYEHGFYGILSADVDRVKIEGGTIYNNSGSGIRLEDCAFCDVTGAEIYDDGAAVQDYGIEETGTANDNRFHNNRLSGNVLQHIVIVGSRTVARDNTPDTDPMVKTLGADVAITSTTYVDVDADLFFTLNPNTQYWIEFVVHWFTNIAGNGCMFSVNGPATPAFLQINVEHMTSATAKVFAQATAYDTIASAGSGSATQVTSRVNVAIKTGAAGGNLYLRGRAETGTTTVKAGTGGWIRHSVPV